ncbi:MAG: hypothetical protein H6667_25010 [Ardenticatenaceae bacterium]|nr:hypothetical protein [Ardenticatenaceae bacterium]MCB9445265.1 hypothetical protein [Ardenticatenaceae bacterium]
MLVVDNQSIMGAGLERLLGQIEAFEVLGVSPENELTLVQEIWRLLPDIIVLVQDSQVIEPGRLLDLLPDYGRLRIVQVSIDSNTVQIFDKQEITINHHGALFDQLKNK